MNLEEIKQQAIESTEKKISRGREMIADTKLDIEKNKKEIKEHRLIVSAIKQVISPGIGWGK